jgi:hypothetical protein
MLASADESEGAESSARRLFDVLFREEIEKQLAVTSRWQGRKAPLVLQGEQLLEEAAKESELEQQQGIGMMMELTL